MIRKVFLFGMRVHLDDTSTIDRSHYSRIRACTVELLLFPEDGLYVPEQRLTMEYDMYYAGDLPLEQVSLLTSIPAGFELDERSGKLGERSLNTRMTDQDMAQWDLGEFANDTISTKFSYDLIPVDPPNIRRATTVTSYMELIPEDGKKLVTTSLNTNISTRVEMIKFDVTLEGALFDVGSYVLKSEAKASIKNIGEFMAWKTDVDILVEGFTDHTGSEEDNLILSQNRANSVRDYLINEYHISPDRIETTGYGEAFPVADNNTREGRALNRRVEIIMNSNFVQKGEEKASVHRANLKLKVDKKELEILNGMNPE